MDYQYNSDTESYTSTTSAEPLPEELSKASQQELLQKYKSYTEQLLASLDQKKQIKEDWDSFTQQLLQEKDPRNYSHPLRPYPRPFRVVYPGLVNQSRRYELGKSLFGKNIIRPASAPGFRDRGLVQQQALELSQTWVYGPNI
jgi:UDP-N-acetylglucosamine pyrophosphorylase